MGKCSIVSHINTNLQKLEEECFFFNESVFTLVVKQSKALSHLHICISKIMEKSVKSICARATVSIKYAVNVC